MIPFIPKDDQELPDQYMMTVSFHSGSPLELEVASHRVLDSIRGPMGEFIAASAAPMLEYVTKDDVWGLIPVSSIKALVFDKRFSRVMELRQKRRVELVNVPVEETKTE